MASIMRRLTDRVWFRCFCTFAQIFFQGTLNMLGRYRKSLAKKL